jgi:putative transposase
MKIEYNNSYTHFIFTTFHRLPLILEENRQQIEKYITRIVNQHDCELYAIYANPEHVHFLVSLAPNMDEERLAELIAKASKHFMNENKFCNGNFKWQNTCSAYSVSKRDVKKVYDYIMGQKEHHNKQPFSEEHAAYLKFYEETIELTEIME